ncbi:MAG: acetyl-CoA carboxylase biotin carboxylase subunit [Gemmatimonadetes bacterium]|nr:acetyl-CoA carboxylase biotin carboxylase subunit [Gemmatimonadota bacterium]
MTLRRVLIANRGEIAVRIIRACHEEGIEAVAVYSEADATSPHVLNADLAIEIGPAPAAESYLNVPRLLDAAKESGADSVHPGYGFLSERAHFAEAVEGAGLVFIGPPPAAMRVMGVKTEARRRMAAAGVPVMIGTAAPVTSAEEARQSAKDIGYPVLLKAAAGGGGKGMRRVNEPGALASALEQASSEALKAFGDGAVYIEKFLEGPRHVEIQVLADAQGRTMHLGERDCSIQRRHQKLIEESPSVAVTAELRRAMGETAVQAAKAVGYRGAGTVEFLLDGSGRYYFLEMNTRIQVEHPVTEMVYGVDLVREQLRVAAGEAISPPNRPLAPRGHAIECRITSEDPFNGFLPATGRIGHLHVPGGPGVRWDGGIAPGNDVTLYYDPLLGKLIVWGETRARAIARMRRALDELVILGVPTSQAFHLGVMNDPEFAVGTQDIGFLERRPDLLAPVSDDAELEAVAIAAALAEDAVHGAADPGRADAAPSRGDGTWTRAARIDGLR